MKERMNQNSAKIHCITRVALFLESILSWNIRYRHYTILHMRLFLDPVRACLLQHTKNCPVPRSVRREQSPSHNRLSIYYTFDVSRFRYQCLSPPLYFMVAVSHYFSAFCVFGMSFGKALGTIFRNAIYWSGLSYCNHDFSVSQTCWQDCDGTANSEGAPPTGSFGSCCVPNEERTWVSCRQLNYRSITS